MTTHRLQVTTTPDTVFGRFVTDPHRGDQVLDLQYGPGVITAGIDHRGKVRVMFMDGAFHALTTARLTAPWVLA